MEILRLGGGAGRAEALQGLLVAAGGSGTVVPLIVAGVGVVFGVVVTLATVPALHRDSKLAHLHMTGAAKAVRLQLMAGLQALADGDLTVELRETMIAAYDAYNRATAQLRQLVDSVGSSRRSPASPSRPTCSRSSA